MQFDVIIGNPPYQLSTGGFGTQAKPIYHKFVEQAKKLEPRYLVMVIPARWYSGGMGLDEFRASMLEDSRIRVIEDFPDSNDIFPGTQIKGGICYFLWSKEYSGNVKVTTHDKGKSEKVLNVRYLKKEPIFLFDITKPYQFKKLSLMRQVIKILQNLSYLDFLKEKDLKI